MSRDDNKSLSTAVKFGCADCATGQNQCHRSATQNPPRGIPAVSRKSCASCWLADFRHSEQLESEAEPGHERRVIVARIRARKKTRQPHFEFAALLSIRVLDAGCGQDSQFCLESSPAVSNGLSEFRVLCRKTGFNNSPWLRKSPGTYTMLQNEKSSCHYNFAAFREQKPVQKSLQNDPNVAQSFEKNPATCGTQPVRRAGT